MTTSDGKNSVSAAHFKATCLKLMDTVEREHIEIEITKRGKPVARLVPVASDLPDFFGSAPVQIHGDIVSPTGETWEAED